MINKKKTRTQKCFSISSKVYCVSLCLILCLILCIVRRTTCDYHLHHDLIPGRVVAVAVTNGKLPTHDFALVTHNLWNHASHTTSLLPNPSVSEGSAVKGSSSGQAIKSSESIKNAAVITSKKDLRPAEGKKKKKKKSKKKKSSKKHKKKKKKHKKSKKKHKKSKGKKSKKKKKKSSKKKKKSKKKKSSKKKKKKKKK